MFPYLQNVSKHLAQLAAYLSKARLLWKFIMTRIMTNQELIKPGRKMVEPERVWWSEQAKFFPAAAHRVLVSGNIPDGSVIHEVQIQCAAIDDIHGTDITINLGLIETGEPVIADVEIAEPVIDWRWIKTGKAWHSIDKYTNEVYSCRKVVHGSNRRLGVAFQTTHVNGAVGRVSVLYSIP